MSGPQKELELGQVLPWQQTRICRLSLGAQKRPQHSACHQGPLFLTEDWELEPTHRCRCTNHSPVSQRSGRKTVVSSWLCAQARHCGVPEPPSPRLHQPGLRGCSFGLTGTGQGPDPWDIPLTTTANGAETHGHGVTAVMWHSLCCELAGCRDAIGNKALLQWAAVGKRYPSQPDPEGINHWQELCRLFDRHSCVCPALMTKGYGAVIVFMNSDRRSIVFTYWFFLIVPLLSHRITEWPGLEGTSRITNLQPPATCRATNLPI